MNGLLTYGLVLFFALAIIASIARHFVLMFRSYDSVVKQLVGSIKITGDQDAAFNELLAVSMQPGLPCAEPTGAKPRSWFGASLDPQTSLRIAGATNCCSQ